MGHKTITWEPRLSGSDDEDLTWYSNDAASGVIVRCKHEDVARFIKAAARRGVVMVFRPIPDSSDS
jgi:hypothetical protein